MKVDAFVPLKLVLDTVKLHPVPEYILFYPHFFLGMQSSTITALQCWVHVESIALFRPLACKLSRYGYAKAANSAAAFIAYTAIMISTALLKAGVLPA